MQKDVPTILPNHREAKYAQRQEENLGQFATKKHSFRDPTKTYLPPSPHAIFASVYYQYAW